MSKQYSPSTNADRDQILQAILTTMTSPGVNDLLLTLYNNLLMADLDAYSAAREAWTKCKSAAREASDAARAADARFDRDMREFSATVRDAEGRATPSVVAELLGGMLPSEITTRSYREEVARATSLLAQLGQRKSLKYGAAHAEALRASTTALGVATSAKEEADRAMRAAGGVLTTTKVSFDRSYMKLVMAAKASVPKETFDAVFPCFVRVVVKGAEGKEVNAPPT